MKPGRKYKAYTLRIPIQEVDPIEELSRELGKSKNDIFIEALKLYAILKFAEKEGMEILIRDKNGEIKQLILP